MTDNNRALFMATLFDIIDDDEDVLTILDIFGFTPPSPEGMKRERHLSKQRAHLTSSQQDFIENVCRIAATISACSNLEGPPSVLEFMSEVEEGSAFLTSVVTSVLGNLAYQTFKQEHNQCHPSG